MSKATLPKPATDLYEEDFNLWLERQVELLREGRLDELDVENLIDEVGGLARMDRYEAINDLRGILWRLLVYQFSVKRRTKCLHLELLEHRHHLDMLLADSPSLQKGLDIEQLYQEARELAAISLATNVNNLPETCPYTLEQVLDTDFFPMSRSDRRAVKSRLVVLLSHLLKYQHQPERRTDSWERTIREARKKLARSFNDMPTLKRYAALDFADCYERARQRAAVETGLSQTAFPEHCPYSFEQILDEAFLPEA
jgi:uncharacterized protein YlaN (UPF0358 family)